MLRVLFLSVFVTIVVSGFSQDVNVLMKEAESLEIKLNEHEALAKYKEVLLVSPENVKALVKATELTVRIGGRLEVKDKKGKQLHFESALAYAKRAVAAEVASAEANYAMALASGKLAEVELEPKKVVAYAKDVKVYADKSIAANPKFGKSYYVLGKWNIDLVNLSGAKKAIVKMLDGSMPQATLEAAVENMEKCRVLEPYFMLNFYELAKVYRQDDKPTKAIEVLQKLVKLPIRTADDATMKAEAQKMLQGEL